MESEQPKQFMNVAGTPILMHTLKAFYDYHQAIELIVVLPSEYMETWMDLCEQHHFKIPHKMVVGGSSRFESSRNGLNVIKGEGLVAIHDAARPLVSVDVIARSFDTAEKKGNGIASVSLKDSIREVSEKFNRNVNRDSYCIIQTPQTFQISLIKKAFESADSSKVYTDDASVLEDIGEEVVLSKGSYENIKVTTPVDLLTANAILNSRK